MKKSNLILLLTIFIMFMVPVYASAVVINFDSLEPQNYLNGNIDNVDLGGVTITSEKSDTTVVTTFGVGHISPNNAITNSTFLAENDLTFLFSDPVNYVKFTGGDEGNDKDQFQVKLFNSANELLCVFTTPVFGGNLEIFGLHKMLDFYTFEWHQDDIKKMVVTAYKIDQGQGIGIDDLEFNGVSVPEPASLLLLGFGLVGLGGLKKRFRK